MASFLRIPGADGETDAEQAIDPSVVDATRIAAVVRDAPDEALRRGMQGAIRELILEEIFRRFPEYFKRGPLVAPRSRSRSRSPAAPTATRTVTAS